MLRMQKYMKKSLNFSLFCSFFNYFFNIAHKTKIQLIINNTKPENDQNFTIFSYIFLKNLFKKSNDPQKTQIVPSRTEKSDITNKNKMERFILFFMLILKFLRNLKMNTSNLRKIKYVNERQISLINDCAYFQENHKNENKSFLFKNKFLRRKF